MKVSVCICSYNRAHSLASTLQSMTQLSLPDDLDWELLIINNNCTDNTQEVVARFQELLPVRCVAETKQGLSNARNRAIDETSGDLIVFCDDDLYFHQYWLTAYVQAVSTFKDAMFFGGRTLLYWPTGKPKWVRDENMPLLGGLFGICDNGDETHIEQDKDVGPYGANFALRRKLFEQIGQFDPQLGMNGGKPGRGEEEDFFQRARLAGNTGVYTADALCYHTVFSSNLKLGYLYRFGIQKGIAHKRIQAGQSRTLPNPVKTTSLALRAILQLVLGRGDTFRQGIINLGIQRGLLQD